ncbi:TonB-dependent receptor [Aquirufa aurantiipilula]|uniref:TonB-dependent receptor n=1 Tax=Aquirufa aurantiipilula TaxID=2696561 RepID=A0ABT6BG31_9BACT|nr:TonB-dependent receptor [Aquirufa aurantiipilula]MDF5689387.1 TonB-dependent receptor [Aquirufa aurantiipilula]
MKFRHLIIIIFSLFYSTLYAQKATLSGYIKDSSNGEGLIGANVYVKELKVGNQSNTYGFYSLTLAPGEYTLVFSYTGYERVERKIQFSSQSQQFSVELKPADSELAEVRVTAKAVDENVKSIEMSVNKIDIKTIKRIPALLGEVDLVRAIQLLPGVSTVGEGASGFNVRGGGVDQNLVLMDDAPVYNSSHLFGFFSVFNPDAVKDVKLFKGGIPAQYGGRVSSILDVKMKEGNTKKLEVNGGIGVIFSRLSIEAPLIKDKASFIVAARRSYIDILAKPFLTGNNANAQFNFYDLTAKVNYNINSKNTVFLSGYFGRDVFGTGFGFNWGNGTLSARWNHVFSNKLFLNATSFYSNYDYLLDSDLENKRPNDSFRWTSNIVNLSFKPDFTYYITPDNTLTFGGQILSYEFKPGQAVASSIGEKREFGQANKRGLEASFYVGNELKFSPHFSAQYGLRYSHYDYQSLDGEYYNRITVPMSAQNPSGYVLQINKVNPDQVIASYGNFEPRLALNWTLNEASSVKASFNRLSQYVHLMSNTAASTPLDVWTSSTNNIKPQIADQVALGFFKNYGESGNDYEASVEVYYKKMQNQIDYADRANLFLNPYFEKDLLFGDGRAYGLEVFVKKNVGKLTGWVSYTLARTERKIDGINNNEWYTSRYDRTHTLNLIGQYALNEKWSFGANFAYITGVPYSIPVQKYVYEGIAYPQTIPGTRGNIRVPDYHRLDISATKKNKKGLFGKGSSEWVFSVYNLYNRKNPFSVYTRPNETNSAQTEAVQLSIIGSFVPAVTYNFSF